ncbi:MAG: hypothetical protein F6K11_18810 [Leptolyngbya sp. SIO3F4]|nr:hypothetical protein [Leptolyngbya sp. SIO3F4]
MATTISKLAVAVTARTDKFNSAMKAAEKQTRSFQHIADQAAKRVALLGAVTGGVAAAGMIKLTKNSLANIDATAKLSDRVGIATEKLIGLEHAAAINGATSKDLHTGLLRMARTIGDAGDGSADATRSLDKLSIAYEDIIDLDPDKQFMAIADAIKEVDNASERVDLAQSIFGRGGANLLNLLMQGSVGMQSLQTSAERLGLTYSRYDASKVEAANDAVTRLTSSTAALGNQAAIGLAPAIESAADMMTALATNTDLLTFFDRIGEIGSAAFDTIADSALASSAAIDFTKIALLDLEKSFVTKFKDPVESGVTRYLGQAGLAARAGAYGAGEFLFGTEGYEQAVDEFQASLGKASGSNPYAVNPGAGDDTFADAERSLANSRLQEIARQQDAIRDGIVERQREIDKLVSRGPASMVGEEIAGGSMIGTLVTDFDRLQQRIDRLKTSPLERFTSEMAMLQDALFENVITLEDFHSSLDVLEADYRKQESLFEGRAPRPGEARQVILEHVALDGIRNVAGSAQEIQSDQLEETNRLLRELVDKPDRGAVLR